jgi:hypothetical protein
MAMTKNGKKATSNALKDKRPEMVSQRPSVGQLEKIHDAVYRWAQGHTQMALSSINGNHSINFGEHAHICNGKWDARTQFVDTATGSKGIKIAIPYMTERTTKYDVVVQVAEAISHIENKAQGIKDMSESNRHNAEFAGMARVFGLFARKGGSRGYTVELTDALKNAVDNEFNIDMTALNVLQATAQQTAASGATPQPMRSPTTAAWQCGCDPASAKAAGRTTTGRFAAGKVIESTCKHCGNDWVLV